MGGVWQKIRHEVSGILIGTVLAVMDWWQERDYRKEEGFYDTNFM